MKRIVSVILLFLFISGVLTIKTETKEEEEGTRVIFYIEN